MGQRESSTSAENSNTEINEKNNDPKERRRSQHWKRNNRGVELKNLDQSSHKNKGRKTEESNLNGRRHSRHRSKSLAMNLNMFNETDDKPKEKQVKSLEETSRSARFRASFTAGGRLKNKGRESKIFDQTKQKKKDLGVKFLEETDKPGLHLVNFNSDERRRSRQKKSKLKDHRDSKSLGPAAELKQKSKARRAKSLEDVSTPGQYGSGLDSHEKTQPGRRSPKSKDPESKAAKDKAGATIFNTFHALRLIDKQLERITKSQECLLTLSRNIQNFKSQVKAIRSTTTERRDKLWDKYEDWQKLVQGFDYPLAHLGAMMNVDMNFLKRLKFLDYVIVSMDTLQENCKKLEKEKETSEAKHQEDRKKLLNERVKLEKVQRRMEDMFPAIRKKMRRKERELHLANKGTQTQTHHEASMTLSNLLSQIHTSFGHYAQNFHHLSL